MEGEETGGVPGQRGRDVLGLNSRVLEEAASADIFRTNSEIADILHVCIVPEKKS